MINFPKKTGWIEVIAGSMFSGKTEELIRRLKRALIAKQKVKVFKPKIDNRYSATHVVSHNDQKIEALLVETSAQILELAGDAQVIGIDEAQFFDKNIVDVANKLADMGRRLIISGLDLDYLGRPFEPMPQLLAIAEYVTKISAICVKCGGPATKNQRIVKSSDKVLVGTTDMYEARCRKCFNPAESE